MCPFALSSVDVNMVTKKAVASNVSLMRASCSWHTLDSKDHLRSLVIEMAHCMAHDESLCLVCARAKMIVAMMAKALMNQA